MLNKTNNRIKIVSILFGVRLLTISCILIFVVSDHLYSQQIDRDRPIRIDSHIHLYDTDRKGSSVFLNPEKHRKIYYPHLVPEFLGIALPAGVQYAVVVEASKRREDNFWVMHKVDESDNLLAFIANLDPRDITFVSDLDELSKSKKFRGIRIRPKTEIDISSQDFIEKMGELAKRNSAKTVLAFLEADRIHNGLALHAFESRFNHAPL